MADKKPVSNQIALPRGPWRTQTQFAAAMSLVVVVAIIIGALYLAQATTTATTGQLLIERQSTRDAFQRGNEDLLAQIANARNINVLRGRAQQLGFVPIGPERLDYMVVNGYSPVRATPTPIVTVVPNVVYDETFTGWAQKQWNVLLKQFEAWSGQPTPPAKP